MWSCNDELATALEQLGRVRHVVKIGHAHGIDDPYYVERYGAAYWALANGTRDTDPAPTETLGPDHLPFADAELFEFRDSKEREAAILVKRGGGILIACDAVQHWPDADGCSPLAKIIVRVMGLRRRPAQISPAWHKFQPREGASLSDDFARRGMGPVEVRAEAVVSLNGRPAAPLIDPAVDLARVDDSLAPATWILPAPSTPPRHLGQDSAR